MCHTQYWSSHWTVLWLWLRWLIKLRLFYTFNATTCGRTRFVSLYRYKHKECSKVSTLTKVEPHAAYLKTSLPAHVLVPCNYACTLVLAEGIQLQCWLCKECNCTMEEVVPCLVFKRLEEVVTNCVWEETKRFQDYTANKLCKIQTSCTQLRHQYLPASQHDFTTHKTNIN